ncbi:spermidine synthase [Defluviimonas sp. SAOS-178_SWC]|uniref:spermidine synthase n=1 Tax=Defluviimonas sp. SAOS-178_SWC TaxID=3121287 RepID=UPI003221C719
MFQAESRAATGPGIMIPVIFTATIFLSASLLFFVQPLFARIVLPQIGGAPAVWTTAMLFFQSVLIGGYLYAHLVTRYLPVPAQIAVHLLLWVSALCFLPLAIPEGWRYEPGTPAVWQTLALFGLGVGVPFAVLSANAPLIQFWYARSDGPSSDDPYFLYGASNLGSLAALLAFPLVAEPLFGATLIGKGWAMGFVALGAFLLASGVSATRGSGWTPVRAEAPAAPVGLGQIGRWTLLAFIPSSMMLAVTTKISTDIGAIPLVWVIPLSLYLLSFVLTFTRRPLMSLGVLRIFYLAALGWLGAVFTGLSGAHVNLYGVAGLIAAFFAVAMFAHTRLYDARPDGRHLTLFYLVMSVGGALGGLFNSIIAPVVFDSLAEGGVTTLLAATLVLSKEMRLTRGLATRGAVAGAIAALPLILAVTVFGIADWLTLKLVMFGLAAVVAVLLRRTVPAAALAAGIVTVSGTYLIPDGDIFRDRSFFGTHRVMDGDGMRHYANGTTIHGAERLSDYSRAKPQPLFYYHPNAPMARVLTSDIGRSAKSVGIVGLGVGSLACYRNEGQDWQFYEIDAVVDRIARNPDYFTFMSACAGDAPTHLGDARMVLAAQEGLKYDILIIDAYGSDAVPMHLTTHEAMQLYLDRLAPDGVLLYHITNRYYAIQRPLARSAEALGLVARIENHPGRPDVDPGDTASRVVMLARSEAALGDMASDARWQELRSDGERLWTDDFANLLSILE